MNDEGIVLVFQCSKNDKSSVFFKISSFKTKTPLDQWQLPVQKNFKKRGIKIFDAISAKSLNCTFCQIFQTVCGSSGGSRCEWVLAFYADVVWQYGVVEHCQQQCRWSMVEKPQPANCTLDSRLWLCPMELMR